MKRYALDGTFYYCPVDLSLAVIGGRWKGLVFWNLRHGAKRYSELKKALVAVNDKMLTQVLRSLERQGVVERIAEEATPSRVDYALTARGRQLLPAFELISDWGEAFVVPDKAPRETAIAFGQ